MKSNMEPFMIRDLPLEERPRERLLLEGPPFYQMQSYWLSYYERGLNNNQR